ncbi:MAG: DUF4397 domain-containing protein [Lysobacterales bacterium]|jgi:hypothetical protein
MKPTLLTLALVSTVFSQSLYAQARVAVAHFAPFAGVEESTAVDVVVNGQTALTDVSFKDFTAYLDFEPGNATVDIIPVGATEPAISGEFMLEDGKHYTVLATGNGTTQPLELWALLDDVDAPEAGNLNLRIVHAAPFAADLASTEVSIRTDGGDLVNGLTGVPYGGNSDFFQIPAGNYDLKVSSNDGSVNFIDIDPVDLPEDADITVFAVGDGINQPLAVIALPVGELTTSPPVDNRSNGMWEIIEGSGTGFILQPMPSQDRLVGSWYTYDESGNTVYLIFDSCLDQSNEMGDFYCSTPGAFDGESATTSLYQPTGGGPNEDDEVTITKIGEIDFEILGCVDAMATVRLNGEQPQMYTAKNLTRPFPCSE